MIQTNIERKRDDTLRIIFELVGKNGAARITSWTQFELIVDSLEQPVGTVTQKEVMTGSLETDGIDGKVKFIPSGTIPFGDYFYEARGRNPNGELMTFAQGTYKIS